LISCPLISSHSDLSRLKLNARNRAISYLVYGIRSTSRLDLRACCYNTLTPRANKAFDLLYYSISPLAARSSAVGCSALQSGDWSDRPRCTAIPVFPSRKQTPQARDSPNMHGEYRQTPVADRQQLVYMLACSRLDAYGRLSALFRT
jgi:hypothetical protein